MDNSFQLKKWERIFRLMDANNDGVLTMDDAIMICERVAKKAGVPISDDIRKPCMDMFKLICGGDGNELTLEQATKTLLQLDKREDNIEMMAMMSKPMFQAIDPNKDGKISLMEYKAAIVPLGVSEADAEVGFNMIDADKNGYLSHEEFALARAHYYFDKEDTVYKHFYGKYNEE